MMIEQIIHHICIYDSNILQILTDTENFALKTN
jgi:hypothetical protein